MVDTMEMAIIFITIERDQEFCISQYGVSKGASLPALPPRSQDLERVGRGRVRSRVGNVGGEGDPLDGVTANRRTFKSLGETRSHEMCKVLCDQASVVDIRFSISKEFWRGYPFYVGDLL